MHGLVAKPPKRHTGSSCDEDRARERSEARCTQPLEGTTRAVALDSEIDSMKIVQCGTCTESFPEYLFEFGIAFRCVCGSIVDRSEKSRADAAAPRSKRTPTTETPRPSKLTIEVSRPAAAPTPSEAVAVDAAEQDRRARELRRRADRICYLIVSTEQPLRQVEAEMHVLRDRCRRYFPEIRGAYEQVYEARFQKLWREFR